MAGCRHTAARHSRASPSRHAAQRPALRVDAGADAPWPWPWTRRPGGGAPHTGRHHAAANRPRLHAVATWLAHGGTPTCSTTRPAVLPPRPVACRPCPVQKVVGLTGRTTTRPSWSNRTRSSNRSSSSRWSSWRGGHVPCARASPACGAQGARHAAAEIRVGDAAPLDYQPTGHTHAPQRLGRGRGVCFFSARS